jgi:hypothetical protein
MVHLFTLFKNVTKVNNFPFNNCAVLMIIPHFPKVALLYSIRTEKHHFPLCLVIFFLMCVEPSKCFVIIHIELSEL